MRYEINFSLLVNFKPIFNFFIRVFGLKKTQKYPKNIKFLNLNLTPILK